MVELIVAILAWLICGGNDNGKPDPYKAAGIAYGLKGNLTDSDIADLGAMLGAMGAFDDDN